MRRMLKIVLSRQSYIVTSISLFMSPFVSVYSHTPATTMRCGAKISCLSWNPYFRDKIASSDYDGAVSVWDTYNGRTSL